MLSFFLFMHGQTKASQMFTDLRKALIHGAGTSADDPKIVHIPSNSNVTSTM
jgi:hypothetical protein